MSPRRDLSRLAASLAAAFLLAASAAAQDAFLIENVNLVDGSGGPVAEGANVLVRGDRILSVSHGPAPRLPGVRLIDGSGKWLMPGLWDLHVHPDDPEVWHVDPAADQKDIFMPLFVAAGVTSVRDTGGALEVIKSWRKRIAADALLGPRIHMAGPLVDGPEPMWPGSVAVTDAASGRAAVDDLVAKGVDFIKVYSLLPEDGFLAIAARCKELDVPFIGHVPRSTTVAASSAAGMASQEHLLGVIREVADPEKMRAAMADIPAGLSGTERRSAQMQAVAGALDPGRLDLLLQQLAAHGTAQVPTMILWKRRAWFDVESPRVGPYLGLMPAYIQKWWSPEENIHLKDMDAASMAGERAYYHANLKILAAMHRAGIAILPGTDTGGNPHLFPGHSVHDELEIFVEAGMTPMEAILAGTVGSARLLRVTGVRGRIAEDMQADMILLDADPTADIRNTRKIAAVVARGHYLDRTDLDAIEAAARAGRALAPAELPSKAKRERTRR